MERMPLKLVMVSIIVVTTLALNPWDLLAQQNEPKKVSLKFGSGVTYGSAGDAVVGRLAGNFNVPSFRQQIYSGSFQYAFSPGFSIDTGVNFGRFTNQYDFDPSYENDFFYTTVKGVTNLNGLLNLNSRFMNPYFSFGLGMIRSQIQTSDLDSDDLSLMGTVGAGMNFYLFRGADLFVQYDYNAAGSDLLDGLSGTESSDQFAAVTAGLRFNFGSSGEKLSSWPPSRTRDSAPVTEADEPDEAEPEIEREETPDPDLERQKEERERQIQQAVDEAYRDMMRQQDQNREFADNWREEQRQKQLEAEARAERERIFTDQPDPGQYVQVFSFSNRSTAEKMRSLLMDELNDQLDQAGQRIIIHQVDGLNRVLIGSFKNYRDAKSMLQYLDYEYGAFIITYPRPDEM